MGVGARFEPLKFILFVVVALGLTGIISIMINTAFPDANLPEVKIPVLLLTIFVSAVIPYTFIIANGKLDKGDFFGLAMYIVIVFLAVIYLPDMFPEWFADNVTLSGLIDKIDFLKSSMGLP